MVMRISKANSLWVFTDTPLEKLNPTLVFRKKTQYVESLVIEVDVRYKPLLKASELLLLLLLLPLLRRDDKPIGIPRSVWRWSG
jgi:hypothetical protein